MLGWVLVRAGICRREGVSRLGWAATVALLGEVNKVVLALVESLVFHWARVYGTRWTYIA